MEKISQLKSKARCKARNLPVKIACTHLNLILDFVEVVRGGEREKN